MIACPADLEHAGSSNQERPLDECLKASQKGSRAFSGQRLAGDPGSFWYQGQAWYRHEIGSDVVYVSPTRIYVPEDGRFIERDPAGWQTAHMGSPQKKRLDYEYVRAAPSMATDATGELPPAAMPAQPAMNPADKAAMERYKAWVKGGRKCDKIEPDCEVLRMWAKRNIQMLTYWAKLHKAASEALAANTAAAYERHNTTRAILNGEMQNTAGKTLEAISALTGQAMEPAVGAATISGGGAMGDPIKSAITIDYSGLDNPAAIEATLAHEATHAAQAQESGRISPLSKDPSDPDYTASADLERARRELEAHRVGYDRLAYWIRQCCKDKTVLALPREFDPYPPTHPGLELPENLRVKAPC